MSATPVTEATLLDTTDLPVAHLNERACRIRIESLGTAIATMTSPFGPQYSVAEIALQQRRLAAVVARLEDLEAAGLTYSS